MSLHAGNREICEITFVDELGVEVEICEVAIGSIPVFGCPGPPKVSDSEDTYTGGVYQFSLESFTNEFSDPDGDSYSKVTLVSTPSVGTVKLSGVEINSGAVISIADIPNLTYEFPTGLEVIERGYRSTASGEETYLERVGLLFKVADDSQDENYSNEAYAHLLLRSSEVIDTTEPNQPATIGDISLTVAANTTTTITMEMIRDLSDPRYSDPENDPIGKITVREIFPDNLGKFYVNNMPIFVGQILTAEDVEQGLFKHVGIQYQGQTADGIKIAVMDTGSGRWSDE